MTDSGKFCVSKLKTDFKACLISEGDKAAEKKDVALDTYLSGYEELYKFLVALGTIFAWVASDVKSKVDQLRSALASHPIHYASLSACIAHEKPPAKNGPLRNLLRLHRALEYIIGFLQAVVKLENDSSPCAPVSQETYNATLAKYHPWVMQKAALLAMKMLPHRGGLFEVIGTNHSRENVEEDLIAAIEVMEEAYKRMQGAFGEADMLNLP